MKKVLLKMKGKTITVCENPINIPPGGIKSEGFDEAIKQNKIDANYLESLFDKIRAANEKRALKEITLTKETPRVDVGGGWSERDLTRPEELIISFNVVLYS